MRVFEAVVAAALLLTLLATVNIASAAMRSNRLARQVTTLTQLTQLDALTGLGNRRCFDDALAQAWLDCTTRQAPLSLIMFDIDQFKTFNDTQGHPAGDVCLQHVAAAVLLCTRDVTDKVARYGGEEFAIILPDASLETGWGVAERVRQAVAACAIPHPAALPLGIVTASLGVACLVLTARRSSATLIEAADRGLYAAKHGGRNRVADAAILQDAEPSEAI